MTRSAFGVGRKRSANEAPVGSFDRRLGLVLLFLEQSHRGRVGTGLENRPRIAVCHDQRILAGLDCSSHPRGTAGAKKSGRATGCLGNAPWRSGGVLSNALSLLARRSWTAGD